MRAADTPIPGQKGAISGQSMSFAGINSYHDGLPISTNIQAITLPPTHETSVLTALIVNVAVPLNFSETQVYWEKIELQCIIYRKFTVRSLSMRDKLDINQSQR